MRRVIVTAMCVCLVISCRSGVRHQSAAGEAPAAAATQPATMPAAGAQNSPVMAVVNGKPVLMARLCELLVTAYGMPVAKDIIALELVERQAARKGITVTDEQVRREHAATLRQRFEKVAKPAQYERLFDQLLARHNISRKHWMLIARRNVLLSKLAPKDISVSDAQVREAYGKLYGRKVQIRHIECASFTDAENLLKKLAEGRDFAELARKYSLSRDRVNGGLLPPFGLDTEGVKPAMRKVAFSLKKVGDVSDTVQVGGGYHILKLEKIIEPDVKFEDVKDKVTDFLGKEKVRVWGNAYLRRLAASASVEYVNPILKAQDQAKRQGPPRPGGSTP